MSIIQTMLFSNNLLYDFTDATFTSGGQFGRSGPSYAQAVSGLTGTGVNGWKNNTEFFNTSSGIMLWKVPETKTYRLELKGASGGGNTTGTFNPTDPERVQKLLQMFL